MINNRRVEYESISLKIDRAVLVLAPVVMRVCQGLGVEPDLELVDIVKTVVIDNPRVTGRSFALEVLVYKAGELNPNLSGKGLTTEMCLDLIDNRHRQKHE